MAQKYLYILSENVHNSSLNEHLCYLDRDCKIIKRQIETKINTSGSCLHGWNMFFKVKEVRIL